MSDREPDGDELAFLMALSANRATWDGRTASDDDLHALLDGGTDASQSGYIVSLLLDDRQGRSRLAALAAPTSAFVGRESETAELTGLVRSGSRWVTVTGPGGIGKSRLVREVGLHVPSIWIPCSDCRTTPDLQRAVARAFGQSGIPGADDFIRMLDGTDTVLVLDDLPVGSAWTAVVADWLQLAPNLQVVVTSRLRRGSPLETVVRLRPLKLHAATEAFRSLLDRLAVRSQVRSAPDSRQRSVVCRRLAGIPLALGLAAGCLADQSPDQLLASLDHVRDARAAQGALSDPLADILVHAMRSLTEPERDALLSLTAFAGDFGIEEASAVMETETTSDVIHGLVAKGLVAAEPSGRAGRYRLHDRVKDAVTQLEVTDMVAAARAKKRHASFFSDKAVKVGALMSAGEWQTGWTSLHDGNAEFRRAVEWAVQAKDHELLKRFSDALTRSYFEAGYLSDFDRLSETAEESARQNDDKALRIRLLGLQGAMASRSGDEGRCTLLWNERLALSRELGDVVAETDTLTDLAWQDFEHGELDNALATLDQAREAGRKAAVVELVATADAIEAKVMEEAGRHAEARVAAERAVGLLSECHDRDLTLFVYQTLARVFDGIGEPDRAVPLLARLLKEAWDGRRAVMTGWALRHLAPRFEETGDLLPTAQCLVAAVAVHNQYATKHKGLAEEALRAFVIRQGQAGKDLVAASRSQTWERLIDEVLRLLDS